MQEGFYTVRILRKTDQCVISVCLQEFFKFCGIYVWEYILDDIGNQDDDEKASVNLFLADCDKFDNQYPKAAMEYLMDIKRMKSYKGFKQGFKKKVKDFFIQLVDDNILIESYKESFSDLAEIFMKHDYAKFNYIKHCMAVQMSKDELQKLAQLLYDCYEDLNILDQKLKKDNNQSPYVIYAMLNCARKVNDCCEIGGNIPLFNIDVLQKEACAIRNLDEKNSMGDVLRCFFEIRNSSYSDQVHDFINEFGQSQKNKRSSQFLLYAIGHYYEMGRRNTEKGWDYYSNILSKDTQNYRALFKKGCREMRDENYENAEKVFRDIIDLMSKKKETGFIQPIELEYWYKSLVFCIRIQKINNKDSSVEGLTDEAKMVKNEEFKNSKFTKDFFVDGNIDKYAEHLIKKMERYHI